MYRLIVALMVCMTPFTDQNCEKYGGFGLFAPYSSNRCPNEYVRLRVRNDVAGIFIIAETPKAYGCSSVPHSVVVTDCASLACVGGYQTDVTR